MLRNCAGTNSQNGYQIGANNISHAPKAAGNPGNVNASGDAGAYAPDALGVTLGRDGNLRPDANGSAAR